MAVEEQKPAVPIKKSVFPDFVICLEDGKKFKSLKRHLRTSYDMTPEQYREKWGLASDYPMVAPNYAAQRSALAVNIGLGQKRKAARWSRRTSNKAIMKLQRSSPQAQTCGLFLVSSRRRFQAEDGNLRRRDFRWPQHFGQSRGDRDPLGRLPLLYVMTPPPIAPPIFWPQSFRPSLTLRDGEIAATPPKNMTPPAVGVMPLWIG